MGWEKVSHSDVKDKHTQRTMVSKEEGSCVAWRRVGAWLHRLLLSLEWSHLACRWDAGRAQSALTVRRGLGSTA